MESEHQNMQQNNEDELALEEESPVPLDAIISLDVWKQIIFPFVGRGNFRFLGAVNKQFQSLYLEMDSSKTTTYDQIFTVEQATLLYQDMQGGVLSYALQRKHYLKYKTSDYLKQEQLFHRDAREGGFQNAVKKEHQYLSCKVMARLGRQEVLEYFHAQDFAWDERTCMAAAQLGHLKLLQWLHERGCSYFESGMCDLATTNGDLSML